MRPRLSCSLANGCIELDRLIPSVSVNRAAAESSPWPVQAPAIDCSKQPEVEIRERDSASAQLERPLPKGSFLLASRPILGTLLARTTAEKAEEVPA